MTKTLKPDPFADQVYFDSCAYDGGDEDEKSASLEAREIYRLNRERILIAHSVASEIECPQTPEWLKGVAKSSMKTVKIPARVPSV